MRRSLGTWSAAAAPATAQGEPSCEDTVRFIQARSLPTIRPKRPHALGGTAVRIDQSHVELARRQFELRRDAHSAQVQGVSTQHIQGFDAGSLDPSSVETDSHGDGSRMLKFHARERRNLCAIGNGHRATMCASLV